MDLEIIILSEVRERQISYYITYMENLKNNDTEKLNFKTETDAQTEKKLMVTKGEREGGIN